MLMITPKTDWNRTSRAVEAKTLCRRAHRGGLVEHLRHEANVGIHGSRVNERGVESVARDAMEPEV